MKKGFTLVELIGVIAILAILVSIGAPSLKNLVSNKNQSIYDSTIEEVKRISKMYLIDNPDLYTDISDKGYADISIQSLCYDEYMTCPVLDPRDNTEIKGYVRVKENNGKYIYEFIRY